MNRDGSLRGPIRVLLADDHQTVLWGLEQLIVSAAPRMAVVGQATCRATLFAQLLRSTPDLILLDLDLAGVCALDFLPDLIGQSRAMVLVLTGSTAPDIHQQAVIRGARGVVSKLEPAAVLITAIERVSTGEIWLDRLSLSRVLDSVARVSPSDPHGRRFGSLTGRERQIVSSVVNSKGAKNKVIADKLHISEHTLRNRLTTIYSKLEVDGRMALYLYATSHAHRFFPMTSVPIGHDS